MELEVQRATHGVGSDGSAGFQDPRRKALGAGAADWSLLLQIDCGEEAARARWVRLRKMVG